MFDEATVVLFGFYGRNYGIRDQVFYELVVFDRAQPLAIAQHLVGPSESRWIPLRDAFPDIQAHRYGDLRIEIKAYHPDMVRVGPPENRFFVILESREKDACAVCHSMPGARQASVREYAEWISVPNQRGYVPRASASEYAYLVSVISAEAGENGLETNRGSSRVEIVINPGADGRVEFERLPQKIRHYGPPSFYFMRAAGGRGLALWHDGPAMPPGGSFRRREGPFYAESLWSCPGFVDTS